MGLPSVIARPVDEARRTLAEAGASRVSVKQTSAPRGVPDGPLRVIRQRDSADGAEIVVSSSVPLPETEARHD